MAVPLVTRGDTQIPLSDSEKNFVNETIPPVDENFTDTKGRRLAENAGLPVFEATTTYAPEVPPPCNRDYPVRLCVDINTTKQVRPVSNEYKFPFWTFDGHVPGPFIRCRVGDVLEVRYTNKDIDGIGHNIDFHCVEGPGGGAPVLYAETGETKVGIFKMLHPGLFMYHCAAAPVPVHIANGMYGMLLVEPEEGLPPVDREFYVMQSEIYGEEDPDDKSMLEPSYLQGLTEQPKYVVFNGREGALTEKSPLLCNQGERVRIYFGNAGPNLPSSFHVIGSIFDKVYRDADLVSQPARYQQVAFVPPGGATVVEFDNPVPGNYTLIDHAIFRIEKGAVGFLKVIGSDPRRDIYDARDRPTPCPGCKLHN